MWKNRIEYLLLVAAGIYLTAMFNRYPTTVVLWIICILPLLFGICIPFWKRKVKVSMSVENEIEEMGGEGKLYITLTNASIFPVSKVFCRIKYRHELDEEEQVKSMELCLDARGKEQLCFDISCPHCGLLTFFCEQVKIVDYFGIFSCTIKPNISKSLVVVPKFQQMLEADVLDLNDPDDEEEQEHSVDVYAESTPDLKEIREYQPGDSLKRIHWKASAKKKKWMTKEYEQEQKEREVMFFSLLYEEEKPGFAWYDWKMQELVRESFLRLSAMRKHEIVWYHPKYQSFSVAKIDEEGDLYQLTESVIRAGFAKKPEDYHSQLQQYLMVGMKNS